MGSTDQSKKALKKASTKASKKASTRSKVRPCKQWMMNSPTGPLYLVASDRGLCAIGWQKADVPMLRSLKGSDSLSQVLATAQTQLQEYFCGTRRSFKLPTDVEGTEFQKLVWAQLRKIPFGATLSYRDVAQMIRKDKAMRAVGAANGRNPLAIVVPCHRVIAANGTLGGYAGGLTRKERLLDLEGARSQMALTL